jgi:hypothetical protein
MDKACLPAHASGHLHREGDEMTAVNRDIVQLVQDVMVDFNTYPRVFVETGTFRGDTTAAMAKVFESVFTVELSPEYWHNARRRLAGVTNVCCLPGDSAMVVPTLCDFLQEPVVWFLDAHWLRRKGKHQDKVPTDNKFPLWSELLAIRQRPYTEIVIVDDVTLFGTREKCYEFFKNVSITNVVKYAKAVDHFVCDEALFMLRRPES